MADTKTTALSAFTPISTDLLYGVDDPGGTPISGKVTFAQAATMLLASPTLTGQITATGGTITTDLNLLSGTQTWNNAGVTFTALKLNVTSTASAAASLLMDLQVGGTSQWKVTKDGASTQIGTMTAPYVASSIAWWAGSASSSTSYVFADTAGLALASSATLKWSSTSGATGSADLFLLRDAANTLAQSNGTAAQTLRVYGSWTDASNGDWLNITKVAGGDGTITTAKNGSGTAGFLNVIGVAGLYLQAGSAYWTLTTSGHFLASTDNTYDIGASGATRPRNVYVGTGVIAGAQLQAGAASYIGFVGRSGITSGSDGVLSLFNNAGTDFTRVTFGGTTSSFPALKRSGTSIIVTGGDDSAVGGLTVNGPTAGLGYSAGAGGAVVQDTSRATTVELNKVSGKITTTNTSLAGLDIVTFTVTNSAVAVTDTIILSKLSGDVDTFAWVNNVAAGSFAITLRNSHAVNADTTAYVTNFTVIKGVIT